MWRNHFACGSCIFPCALCILCVYWILGCTIAYSAVPCCQDNTTLLYSTDAYHNARTQETTASRGQRKRKKTTQDVKEWISSRIGWVCHFWNLFSTQLPRRTARNLASDNSGTADNWFSLVHLTRLSGHCQRTDSHQITFTIPLNNWLHL